MKKKVVAVAVFLCATTAQASNFAGWYMGGKAGRNRSDISGATTASKENAETWGFEEGYNLDRNGILVGGDFFVDINQKTNRTSVAVFSGSATLGLDLKLGRPTGNFLPYIKLGWDRTTGTGAFPAAQFKYANDLHKGAGLEYKFSPHWSVTGEWTTSASKINGSQLKNDNFTFGLNYYFFAPPSTIVPAEPRP